MKEIIVHPLPEITTELVDSPVPVPAGDQVLIKVAVVGSNVKGEIINPTMTAID